MLAVLTLSRPAQAAPERSSARDDCGPRLVGHSGRDMRIGYKLIAEAYGPAEMVRQCVRAEQAGFDFVEISDRYHPWVSEQQHSGFVWSMLAAMAARTERIELATGVTCPFIRYHPAVIAQAAATTQLLADGRFTLGVGTRRPATVMSSGRGPAASGPSPRGSP